MLVKQSVTGLIVTLSNIFLLRFGPEIILTATTDLSKLFVNRGIKHDFPFINIRKVPREVLITKGEAGGFQHFPRDLANVNE